MRNTISQIATVLGFYGFAKSEQKPKIELVEGEKPKASKAVVMFLKSAVKGGLARELLLYPDGSLSVAVSPDTGLRSTVIELPRFKMESIPAIELVEKSVALARLAKAQIVDFERVNSGGKGRAHVLGYDAGKREAYIPALHVNGKVPYFGQYEEKANPNNLKERAKNPELVKVAKKAKAKK